jgi:hypothetical protein
MPVYHCTSAKAEASRRLRRATARFLNSAASRMAASPTHTRPLLRKQIKAAAAQRRRTQAVAKRRQHAKAQVASALLRRADSLSTTSIWYMVFAWSSCQLSKASLLTRAAMACARLCTHAARRRTCASFRGSLAGHCASFRGSLAGHVDVDVSSTLLRCRDSSAVHACGMHEAGGAGRRLPGS